MIVDFLTGFAVFFIIWWLVLFTVLPWGMRSAHEEGADVAVGHDRAAPVKVNMWNKFAWTTAIALVIYGLYYWFVHYGGLSLDDFPFMPKLPTG